MCLLIRKGPRSRIHIDIRISITGLRYILALVTVVMLAAERALEFLKLVFPK